MPELGSRPYAEGCATSPVAFVEGLFVDADLRRRGVAAAEARARAAGYRELASDALIANAPGHAWHRGQGFTEVERIVCFRKEL